MRSLWSCWLMAAALAVGLTEIGSAQSRPGTSGSLTGGSTGGFTGGSMFSSGTSGLGGGLGGQSGLSSGLGGQSGLGGGLGGQSGLGGGLGGQSGLGGGQGGLGGQNPFGQQNSGFIGRNGANNQFIGANTGQTQNGLNGNQGRQGARGQRGQNQQQNQFNQNNGGGQEANRNLGVRPRQKVAFDHPILETPQVVGKIEAHFQKLASRHSHLSSVKLTAEEDGTVVLTGEAKSHADAKMAESLVRLEPGVRGVRNEMTYPSPVDEVQ